MLALLIRNLAAATASADAAATAIESIPSPSGSATLSPSDEASARAELRIIQIDEEGAKLQADLDERKKLVSAEEAVATKIGEHITDLQDVFAKANDQLQKMRDAAGLGDSSGVGAEKKKLTDDLNEARARLQYLEDTSKGTKDDLKAIETQKKTADDLTARLNDAEQRLRIADYELTHSDAWKKQLQTIADQEAAIKAEQEKQAEEKKRVDELKEVLATREAAAQKLADERAEQQAILDKQQQDAQAAATAQRKADLEKELGMLAESTAIHTLTIHAAAAEASTQVQTAVAQATTQLQDTATQASETIAASATAAVASAGAAITSQVSEAMKSLLALLAGGNQTSQDAQGRDGHDIGSQFAGQFFDETGQIGGGAIGDATYATYVQAYIASKARYLADNAPGRQGYQFAEARQQQQLEALWQELGGFARFHKTLEQIARDLQTQSSAISSVSRAVSAPKQPATSQARVQIFLPRFAPPKPPGQSLLSLIRTGRL